MAARKSAISHLTGGRTPHIVHMIPPGAPGFREAMGGAMVVSSPAEVDGLIRSLMPGEVITLDDLRAALARRHQVAVACPVSTAIFANMGARAAEEQRSLGVPPDQLTPWWRVLKRGGLLNPKLPGGVEAQAFRLREDGIHSGLVGRHPGVLGFKAHCPSDLIENRVR